MGRAETMGNVRSVFISIILLATAAIMESDGLRVKLGDTVIFDVNGEKQMFITVKPKR